ncbi:hypothetical protein [Nocardioides dongkuii]|uniref:hypothetical protein n=1 Tax=Nocardioides dongkuii TaxID=2760089 RepID=UPI001877FA8E|nr:hypothetical protein [Nocardioides dongkuii]
MILSSYEMRARLSPGLLGIAPVSIAIATLGLGRFPAIALASGILTAAGGAYLLSNLVGAAGRRAQDALWAAWGGPPTIRMLRLREPTTNATRRSKWRDDVAALTGVALLTEDAEAFDNDSADEALETAIGGCLYLGHAGDDGHPMVQAENAQYGFERNMYGFRWIARLIATLSLIALAASFWTPWEVSERAVAVGLIVNSAFLLMWLVVPSKTRVRQAADRYAIQLLNAAGSAVRKAT